MSRRHWLYLDFDGVLHPAPVYVGPDGRPRASQGDLFMWAGLLEEALRPYPDLKIVLSTSWAEPGSPVGGLAGAATYLPPLLRSRVIGTSQRRGPSAGYYDVARGEQVELHVSANKPDAWIAVDDDWFGWSPKGQEHLVLCDSLLGLTDPPAMERLQELLMHMHESEEG